MSVRGNFSLDKPGAMEATMQLTMTIDEWKELRERIGTSGHPEWCVHSVITNLIMQAETTFWAKGKRES